MGSLNEAPCLEALEKARDLVRLLCKSFPDLFRGVASGLRGKSSIPTANMDGHRDKSQSVSLLPLPLLVNDFFSSVRLC